MDCGCGHSHFSHRAGVLFDEFDSLRDPLAALADKERTQRRPVSKVAFAYTGPASQWVGMGKRCAAPSRWCELRWIEHNVASDGIGLSVAVDNGTLQVISEPAVGVEAVRDIAPGPPPPSVPVVSNITGRV